MRPFTKRQWKALLVAYPLYATASATSAHVSDDALATRVADFLQDGVPKVQRAFQNVLAHENVVGITPTRKHEPPSPARTYSIPPPLHSSSHHWRETVPHDVDSLLAYLFFSLPETDDAADAGAHPFGLGCSPLTEVEKLLLGLWSRERQRAEAYFDAHQRLEQDVRRTAQALLQCVDSPVEGENTTSAAPRFSVLSDSLERTPVAPARGEQGVAGVYRSRLAGVPLTAEGLAELQHLQELSAMTANACDGAGGVVSAVMCAGCGLADGELFTCGQCGCVRHEACDGPHPSEGYTSGVGPSSLSLCRACRRALRVDSGSSSSSLRSSTSTDERAALDQEFGTDDENTSNESSLSGFIVNTSEDDEDEEGEEEGEDDDDDDRSTSALRTHAPHPALTRKEKKGLKRRRASHSDGSDSADERAERRRGRSCPSPGSRRPPPSRRTTERDADEELDTLFSATRPPAKGGKQAAAASTRSPRASRGRRSELIVTSSASSSSDMRSLSDGSSS